MILQLSVSDTDFTTRMFNFANYIKYGKTYLAVISDEDKEFYYETAGKTFENISEEEKTKFEELTKQLFYSYNKMCYQGIEEDSQLEYLNRNFECHIVKSVEENREAYGEYIYIFFSGYENKVICL